MKGFYIFEEGDRKGAVGGFSLNITKEGFTPASRNLNICGRAVGDMVTARCSKNDNYDFEVGALITLLKMCRVDAVEKAFYEVYKNEIEKDEAENSAKENEYEEKIHALEEDNKRLKEKLVKRKKLLNSIYGQAASTYEIKVAEVEKLEKENKDLKAANCAKAVLIGKLLKDYDFAKSEYEIMAKKTADLAEKVKKLEEENEKLKLDCEKLQHGYIDTDMMFCGRRRNGKQFTYLEEAFKIKNQKKVDTGIIRCAPLTKREELWDSIRNSKQEKVVIEVNKEDIFTFLKELNALLPDD